MIKYKSTEFMTFSMCVATFVVSLLWTIYGQLVQDNFILVSGAFFISISVITSKKYSAQESFMYLYIQNVAETPNVASVTTNKGSLGRFKASNFDGNLKKLWGLGD